MGIGEGIRKMRKQHKLTMDQLANNLNTTNNRILLKVKYLSGRMKKRNLDLVLLN